MKLYGLPETIVSDRGPTFTGRFWQELFRVQGVHLNYSSAYHTRSDRQTEVVNKTLEEHLRCFTKDKPHDWSKWLHMAKWWYDTNYRLPTWMSPYEVLYGYSPPQVLNYIPGTINNQAVEEHLKDRPDILQTTKRN